MDRENAQIAGVEPLVLLQVGETRAVIGSGKKPWLIKRCDGYYTCSCGAFQHGEMRPVQRRTCAHLRALLGNEYEEARLRQEQKKREVSPITGKRKLSPLATSSQPSSSKSVPADSSDYAAFVDSENFNLEAVSQKPGRLVVSDPWSGHLTFNGRVLSKNLNAETAVPFMLSEQWDTEKMDPTGWWMSEKLDGCRAYWTGDRLISRSGRDWKAPQWFLDKLPQEFALDGELWRDRDSFEGLQSICFRSDSSAWRSINFFVFDAPGVPLGFEERLEAARSRCPDGELTPDAALSGRFGGRIALLPQIRCTSKRHLLEYLDSITNLCGEGIMLRRQNSPYERKRSGHSRKVKSFHEAYAAVVGYARSEGQNAGQMGSLGLLMECGTIFTCGSGLTDQMRREWYPPIGSIVEYRFHEMTQDGVPRWPTFLRVAHERNKPQDAEVRSADLRVSKRLHMETQRKGEREASRKVFLEDLVRQGMVKPAEGSASLSALAFE